MPYSPELNNAQYMSFTTYRKTGVAVSTPLWCAGDGHHYYIFSAANAGKVKRLKNSTKAALTPCNFKGDTYGNTLPASAELISEKSDILRAQQVLLKKYGWQLRLTDLLSRLSGKYHKRQYIRVTIN
ncbi:hypothetical protein EDC56_2009 [Sinobacterium caligoides]|uniref:Pyridoxamine 5'-phosphate oxidase N-terminal domain-containing protein n=1 Tax=Sinobacterium caligoides TaxID=933926 RepID=A0A3N2DP40_9GAMM|nr:PPOX class F420-dependent oxidoreductase [Sinobacterium caligoides]ROS01567.1 hypothetical protein EDC56_2009 [Sinobacterium caligoides]